MPKCPRVRLSTVAEEQADWEKDPELQPDPPGTKRMCNGQAFPLVQLTLEKKKCIRKTGDRVTSPRSIADVARKLYGCEPQEHAAVFAMNGQNEILNVHEISLGGFGAAQVDPKVVFTGVLLSGASAFALVHNHPSGAPEPSQMDVDMTKNLARAAEMIGVKLLDHVIVTRDRYYSFMESMAHVLRT